jgi:5'-nucleotidase
MEYIARPKKAYKETVYLNPIEVAQDMARILKHNKKCDLVICLSHLGFSYKNEPNKVSDLDLAKKTKDIDLIIGGHTHTFLEQAEPVRNAKGKTVHVNQAGWAGLKLGRVAIEF